MLKNFLNNRPHCACVGKPTHFGYTFSDVEELIGARGNQARRILKLNDLIPELQELISEGKLGTTAGEQLAHLTEDDTMFYYSFLGG